MPLTFFRKDDKETHLYSSLFVFCDIYNATASFGSVLAYVEYIILEGWILWAHVLRQSTLASQT